MSGLDAIKKFFGEDCDGKGREYSKVTNTEILQFKKADPEGFDEVRNACVEYFNTCGTI